MNLKPYYFEGAKAEFIWKNVEIPQSGEELAKLNDDKDKNEVISANDLKNFEKKYQKLDAAIKTESTEHLNKLKDLQDKKDKLTEADNILKEIKKIIDSAEPEESAQSEKTSENSENTDSKLNYDLVYPNGKFDKKAYQEFLKELKTKNLNLHKELDTYDNDADIKEYLVVKISEQNNNITNLNSISVLIGYTKISDKGELLLNLRILANQKAEEKLEQKILNGLDNHGVGKLLKTFMGDNAVRLVKDLMNAPGPMANVLKFFLFGFEGLGIKTDQKTKLNKDPKIVIKKPPAEIANMGYANLAFAEDIKAPEYEQLPQAEQKLFQYLNSISKDTYPKIKEFNSAEIEYSKAENCQSNLVLEFATPKDAYLFTESINVQEKFDLKGFQSKLNEIQDGANKTENSTKASDKNGLPAYRFALMDKEKPSVVNLVLSNSSSMESSLNALMGKAQSMKDQFSGVLPQKEELKKEESKKD
ncbi:MAG TPA: hypothetical protein PLQ36_00220 [Candidatus Gracilibacteria bacterium]|mgnify:CR=1 FL=1|nr:hypothetical protein [Candidatus Gracilibacteria bacterium]